MTQSPPIPAIDVLTRYSTPTVANAIELFDIRPRDQGYVLPGLQCLLPNAAPIAGYAATCVISSHRPALGAARESRDYWEHVASIPGPRIAVVQDIDEIPGLGSFWGEVNASVHKALGCVGTITNGGIRDMPEMRALGFQALHAVRCVSHGYIHIESFGKPVDILGITIHPGDLLQADEHGVLVVPVETLPHLEEAILEMEKRERPVIDYCKRKDVDRAELWSTILTHVRNAPPWQPRAK